MVPPPLLSSLLSLVVVLLLVCSTAIDEFSMRVVSPGVVTKRHNLPPNVKDRSSITPLYSASNDIDDEAITVLFRHHPPAIVFTLH